MGKKGVEGRQCAQVVDGVDVAQVVDGVHQTGKGEWGYCGPACPCKSLSGNQYENVLQSYQNRQKLVQNKNVGAKHTSACFL